jgi:dTDP-4-dehydrorhamnose 3,5-epimerase-like enzyme
MSEINIIEGEIFVDERGKINSLNNFTFDDVQRIYFIHHPDKSIIRGWHGHKHEKKWFYCVKGEFVLGIIKPDNWENPDPDLKPEIFNLSEAHSKIICVPEGYTNSIKAITDNSTLLVLSAKKVPEAYADSWRYNKDLWIDWSKY